MRLWTYKAFQYRDQNCVVRVSLTHSMHLDLVIEGRCVDEQSYRYTNA